MRNWFAVIDIAGRDFHVQQFAAMIDHDRQFEAEEPPGRTLAARSDSRKDSVSGNAQVGRYSYAPLCAPIFITPLFAASTPLSNRLRVSGSTQVNTTAADSNASLMTLGDDAPHPFLHGHSGRQ